MEITTTNYSTSHIYSKKLTLSSSFFSSFLPVRLPSICISFAFCHLFSLVLFRAVTDLFIGKGGWYTLTVTARDGSSSSTTSISLLLQSKRACYTFQLFSMVDGEERYIPTLTLGQQLPLYARVVDPSDPSLSRSAHLSSLFSALGELPFVTWDYTVPYSPQPSETPLQLVFGVFNATKGVWQGTLTSLTDISGIFFLLISSLFSIFSLFSSFLFFFFFFFSFELKGVRWTTQGSTAMPK